MILKKDYDLKKKIMILKKDYDLKKTYHFNRLRK